MFTGVAIDRVNSEASRILPYEQRSTRRGICEFFCCVPFPIKSLLRSPKHFPMAMLPPSVRPLLLLLYALLLIATLYWKAFSSGILECPGLGALVTPAISLLMFDGPGRVIGQIGFPALGAMFCTCVVPLRRGLQACLMNEPTPPSTNWLIASACIAFAGLALVGAVPLQRNVCDVMSGRAPLSPYSIIHQMCAAVFFAGSALHMALWLMLAARVSKSCTISRASRPFSFAFKACCFVLSWLPLPAAFALHPASPLRTRLRLSDADAGGIQQYMLVVCVACFFASYSIELHVLETLAAPSDDGTPATTRRSSGTSKQKHKQS
jgi:hypothetical protein